jgi:adenylate cyclase, class 1
VKDQIERYKKYNRNRKIKAISFNETKAIILFKIIPFLLNSNYPDLPGYIDSPDSRFGIHRFLAEKIVTPELFERYFPGSTALSHKTNSPFTKSPCIHSLKTIGSIGTIAQTEKSDCDYWVSIRQKELSKDGIELLEEKCTLISAWAMEHEIEVYFFLMDIDQTRKNEFDSRTEDESAGSALKLLLKDELFRTHILVAGKMLLWWLIPPGLSESEYRDFSYKLHKTNRISPNSFVDLGYISGIPKSEIFGACLWQMNKALDSPYKSVIKFAYLELLLRHSDHTLPLFSDKVKCQVTFPGEAKKKGFGSQISLINIDPYLLMAKELVAFYKNAKGKKDQAELIQACLYLKTLDGIKLQIKNQGKKQYTDTILKMMQKWNLLPEKMRHYDMIQLWNYRELTEFGTRVHDYLIETYQKLRWIFKSFNEGEEELSITNRDLSVLGRKLFTFHEKKKYKIEYIKSISHHVMNQNSITFHITKFEGIYYFYVFQGEHDHLIIKENTDYLIRRENNLVELVTWLLINGIINEKTRIYLTKNLQPIYISDLHSLVKLMLKTFPRLHFGHIEAEQLISHEGISKVLLVVNLFRNPIRDSKKLESTFVSLNSYGEYFVQHYDTLVQLKNVTRVLLSKHYVSRWNKNLKIFIPTQREQHLIHKMLEN